MVKAEGQLLAGGVGPPSQAGSARACVSVVMAAGDALIKAQLVAPQLGFAELKTRAGYSATSSVLSSCR